MTMAQMLGVASIHGFNVGLLAAGGGLIAVGLIAGGVVYLILRSWAPRRIRLRRIATLVLVVAGVGPGLALLAMQCVSAIDFRPGSRGPAKGTWYKLRILRAAPKGAVLNERIIQLQEVTDYSRPGDREEVVLDRREDIERYVGQVLAQSLVTTYDSYLKHSHVALGETDVARSVSPPGNAREVAVPVDPKFYVPGSVRPGDVVEVWARFAAVDSGAKAHQITTRATVCTVAKLEEPTPHTTAKPPQHAPLTIALWDHSVNRWTSLIAHAQSVQITVVERRAPEAATVPGEVPWPFQNSLTPEQRKALGLD